MYLVSLMEQSIVLTKEYLHDKFSKLEDVDAVKLTSIVNTLFTEKEKKAKLLIYLLNLLTFPITILFTLYESEDFEQAFKKKFMDKVMRGAIFRIEFRLGLK